MSVARSAIKKQPVDRNTSMLQTFIWEGADKRGVKMKGEQTARKRQYVASRAAPSGHRAQHGEAKAEASVRRGGEENYP